MTLVEKTQVRMELLERIHEVRETGQKAMDEGNRRLMQICDAKIAELHELMKAL